MPTVRVKISVRSLQQLFEGCSLKYILKVCGGRCCSSPGTADGFAAVVLSSEIPALVKRGVDVQGNFIKPRDGEHRCPFQAVNGLCELHDIGLKPLACQLTPFTLNRNNTLVVKNRSRLLKCYRDKSVARTPAYIAYRQSLDAMFGLDQAADICQQIDAGSGDFFVEMDSDRWERAVQIRDAHYKKIRGK